MKTKRSWMLAVAMLSLTAGGVWAEFLYPNAGTNKVVDCCLDPTCPPGCSPACPPDCLEFTAQAKINKGSRSSCCSDGMCRAAAPAHSTKPVAKKYLCPPCPFCPGW